MIRQQYAFLEMHQRLSLTAATAPMELRPLLEGKALAFKAASRLPERGGSLILLLARKHAADKTFHRLCKI